MREWAARQRVVLVTHDGLDAHEALFAAVSMAMEIHLFSERFKFARAHVMAFNPPAHSDPMQLPDLDALALQEYELRDNVLGVLPTHSVGEMTLALSELEVVSKQSGAMYRCALALLEQVRIPPEAARESRWTVRCALSSVLRLQAAEADGSPVSDGILELVGPNEGTLELELSHGEGPTLLVAPGGYDVWLSGDLGSRVSVNVEQEGPEEHVVHIIRSRGTAR